MAEYLVTVPQLGIKDTLIEAQKPSYAARRVIDEHDDGHLSLREASGILVKVKDENGRSRTFKVLGTVKNEVEEVK